MTLGSGGHRFSTTVQLEVTPHAKPSPGVTAWKIDSNDAKTQTPLGYRAVL